MDEHTRWVRSLTVFGHDVAKTIGSDAQTPIGYCAKGKGYLQASLQRV